MPENNYMDMKNSCISKHLKSNKNTRNFSKIEICLICWGKCETKVLSDGVKKIAP